MSFQFTYLRGDIHLYSRTLLPSFSGAFSNVYKAMDRRANSRVAIKCVRKFELNHSQVRLDSSAPSFFMILPQSFILLGETTNERRGHKRVALLLLSGYTTLPYGWACCSATPSITYRRPFFSLPFDHDITSKHAVKLPQTEQL